MKALFEMEPLITGDLHNIAQQAKLLTIALRGQDAASPEEAGLIADTVDDIALQLASLTEKLQTKHKEALNSMRAAK